ncbi:MAG: hypothetical protein Q8S84_07410 [bacterium]|nr:hypothetical protein [bacterium]MDP3381275.1 hypothetical protein [bacterium]
MTNNIENYYDDQTIELLKLHHVQISEFDEETGEFKKSGYFHDNLKFDYGPYADEAEDPLEY